MIRQGAGGRFSVGAAALVVLVMVLSFTQVEEGFAGKPRLDAKYKVVKRLVTVTGTVGRGGPKRPARRAWRVRWEQKSGKKWAVRRTGKLRNRGKGSSFRFSMKVVSGTSVTLRVRLKAGRRVLGSTKPKTLKLGNIKPEPEEPTVRINLSGARALAVTGAAQPLGSHLASPEGETGSNLLVVDESGESRDAVTEGELNVDWIHPAPDGDVYIALVGRMEDGCEFLVLRAGTETPQCADPEISPVTDHLLKSMNLAAIHFEPDGSMYYWGTPKTGTPDTRPMLRRLTPAGEASTVLRSIVPGEFLVLSDGSVIRVEQNDDQHNPFSLIRTYPGGSFENLGDFGVNFFELFPNGELFVGRLHIDASVPVPEFQQGVIRYSLDSKQFAADPWLAFQDFQNSQPGATFRSETWCDHLSPIASDEKQGFCNTLDTRTKLQVDDRYFMVAGRGSGISCRGGENDFCPPGDLVQYYPTIEFPDTGFRQLDLDIAVGSRLVLAGRDEAGVQSTVLFDPVTENRIELIGAASGIEVSDLRYTPGGTEVVIRARRISDQQALFGSIDLTDNSYSTVEAPADIWREFEAFSG